MPNVAWQEPQALIDLLAVNLYAAETGMRLPGPREVGVVSPWLGDVELELRASPWHLQPSLARTDLALALTDCLGRFLDLGWSVEVAVLGYGTSPAGMSKPKEKFQAEVRLLRGLLGRGATVWLAPTLHAKGVVTPLGIITGSTNLTQSGLFL
jgi:hypothetical protein